MFAHVLQHGSSGDLVVVDKLTNSDLVAFALGTELNHLLVVELLHILLLVFDLLNHLLNQLFVLLVECIVLLKVLTGLVGLVEHKEHLKHLVGVGLSRD